MRWSWDLPDRSGLTRCPVLGQWRLPMSTGTEIHAVATNLQGAVELLQGVEDGTLLPAVSTTTNAANYLIALGDLNGDGVIDVVVPNLSSSNVLVSLGSISAMRPWLRFLSPAAVVIMSSPVMRETPTQP